MNSYAVANMWQDRAENGDPVAQFNLGYCYEMGQGLPVNLEEACRWYIRAANQGYPRAQYHLGLACSFGGVRGLKHDPAQACKWLMIAARNGILHARHALNELKTSPEERSLGEKLAREFLAHPEPQNRILTDMQMPFNSPAANGKQMGFEF
ncbi:MAG TPA: tetratricopeptide repeat protein [Verrucomicrobiae bacterium]|jgi:TPR repeat protein